MADIDKSIEAAARLLGYPSLKQEQKIVINQFLAGKDVFAVLPTGFGKTLCFACLPSIYDDIRKSDRSIIVVVSPLLSIMKEQVSLLTKM